MSNKQKLVYSWSNFSFWLFLSRYYVVVILKEYIRKFYGTCCCLGRHISCYRQTHDQFIATRWTRSI